MHQYIQAMKEHEFVLWVIGAKAEDEGKFVYTLPENVTEVHQVFLDDALRLKAERGKKCRLSERQRDALQEVMDCGRPDWEALFSLFQEQQMNPMNLLVSEEFLELLLALCREQYPYTAFAEFFHTIRSMLLPLFYMMSQKAPEADAYHAICTGYGGILGMLGHYTYKKPMLLTEHGIYSREREEEIIRARWVVPSFKKHWIRFFYMLSDGAYQTAWRITALFVRAMETQIQLGAAPEKCRVIGNGIAYERFADIPIREEDGWVNIGAVVRMAPIKDVKTMIYAFHEVSSRVEQVRLYIMGGVDDEAYAEECYSLVRQLGLKNLFFTGRVEVTEAMEKLDFTILTSISEGQPLSVLESLAAGRPCVTTDVGCCRELLDGTGEDDFGRAGYCVPPMYREGLAEAMVKMCRSRRQRLWMGSAGKKRVKAFFRQEMMMENYRKLYEEVRGKWQE